MSAPQFTPAPWNPAWWYWVLRDLHNTSLAEDTMMAGFNYPGFSGDNDANANLIAAAPELYEALENLLDECLRPSTASREAEAALAKARGEQA